MGKSRTDLQTAHNQSTSRANTTITTPTSRISMNPSHVLLLFSLGLASCLADGPGGHHHHHDAHHSPHHAGAHHAPSAHHTSQVGAHGSTHHSTQVHHSTGASHQTIQNHHQAPASHHSPAGHHAPSTHHASAGHPHTSSVHLPPQFGHHAQQPAVNAHQATDDSTVASLIGSP